MGNIFQVTYRRLICKNCNKSAIVPYNPIMGLVHSDVCPFCSEQLQIETLTLSLEERKTYMVEHVKAGIASDMYDLSKLLK